MAQVVAVTGASGFIGSAVVRRLLATGRDVRALIEPGADTRNLDSLDVDRCACDVLDAAALSRALDGCESLYHLAAVYRTWAPDPTSIYRVNVEGTTAVLLAAQAARVKRVVYTSSVAALGLPEGALAKSELATETTAFNLFSIANDYMVSKWLSERVALRFAEAGLDLVVVNPSLPFGPGDIAPTPTGRMVQSVMSGAIPGCTRGGFNAVDVDDCAAGHVLAEEKGKKGERYILGGENVSLREFLDLTARVAGAPRPWLPLPATAGAAYALGIELWADHVSHEAPAATYRSMRYMQRKAFYSIEKARRELGYTTRPLEETVRRAVDWFRAFNGGTH